MQHSRDLGLAPALSIKYTDIARDNEDDKTPKLSVQLMNIALRKMSGGLMLVQYRAVEGSGGLIGVGYYAAEGVRWADGTSILHSGGSPIGSG